MKKTLIVLITFFFCLSAHSQYVDIRHYGASTSSGDNSDAIQRAIDENPNRTIFFPSGDFYVLKTIRVNHPVEIIGENINTTIFRPSNCNGFQINVSGVTIKNMSIFGHQNDSNTYTGILGYGKKTNEGENDVSIHRLTFESLRIQHMKIGIELKYAWNCVINNVKTFLNANNPKVLQGIRLYGKCVNNHISNCHIEAEGIGVSVIHPEQNGKGRAEGLMITNSFIGSGNYGIYSEGILSMNVSNCTIDLTKRSAIEVTRTDGMLLSNNWIALNVKSVQENEQNHPIIKLILSHNSSISNNHILYAGYKEGLDYDNVTNVGISFESNSTNCTVIGNAFENVKHKTIVNTGSTNIMVNYNTKNP